MLGDTRKQSNRDLNGFGTASKATNFITMRESADSDPAASQPPTQPNFIFLELYRALPIRCEGIFSPPPLSLSFYHSNHPTHRQLDSLPPLFFYFKPSPA